jgi:hypothetical protein
MSLTMKTRGGGAEGVIVAEGGVADVRVLELDAAAAVGVRREVLTTRERWCRLVSSEAR